MFSFLCVVYQSLSRVRLFVTPWTSQPGSSVHGILQARVLEWVAMPFLQGNLPDPGIEPTCLSLEADTLPSEPPGKPIRLSKNYQESSAK